MLAHEIMYRKMQRISTEGVLLRKSDLYAVHILADNKYVEQSDCISELGEGWQSENKTVL